MYEGAIYSNGLFRSSLNSKMRTLGQPFSLVQRECFIDKIYEIVRASPVGDTNFDTVVDISDLTILASQWGTIGPDADFNRDRTIDVGDLVILSTNWTYQQNIGISTQIPNTDSGYIFFVLIVLLLQRPKIAKG